MNNFQKFGHCISHRMDTTGLNTTNKARFNTVLFFLQHSGTDFYNNGQMTPLNLSIDSNYTFPSTTPHTVTPIYNILNKNVQNIKLKNNKFDCAFSSYYPSSLNKIPNPPHESTQQQQQQPVFHTKSLKTTKTRTLRHS